MKVLCVYEFLPRHIILYINGEARLPASPDSIYVNFHHTHTPMVLSRTMKGKTLVAACSTEGRVKGIDN